MPTSQPHFEKNKKEGDQGVCIKQSQREQKSKNENTEQGRLNEQQAF